MSNLSKQGTVKWFGDKGYGFITADSDNREYFVHWSNVLMEGHKTLEQGQRVEFNLEPGEKGPAAVNVMVME